MVPCEICNPQLWSTIRSVLAHRNHAASHPRDTDTHWHSARSFSILHANNPNTTSAIESSFHDPLPRLLFLVAVAVVVAVVLVLYYDSVCQRPWALLALSLPSCA